MEASIESPGAPEMFYRSHQYSQLPGNGRKQAAKVNASGKLLSKNKTRQEAHTNGRNRSDGNENKYGSLRSELRRQKAFVVVKSTSERNDRNNTNGNTGHFNLIKNKLKGYRESAYDRRDRYASSIDDEVFVAASFTSTADCSGDTVTTAHETLGSLTVHEQAHESVGLVKVDENETNIEVYSADRECHDMFELSSASSLSTSASFATSRAIEKMHGSTGDSGFAMKENRERRIHEEEQPISEQQVGGPEVSSEVHVRHYDIYASISSESSSSDHTDSYRDRSLLDVFSHSTDDDDYEVTKLTDELAEMSAQTHEFQQRGKVVNQSSTWQLKPAPLEIPVQSGRSGGRLSMSKTNTIKSTSCKSLGTSADQHCVEQFLESAERFERKKQMGGDEDTNEDKSSFWLFISMSRRRLAEQFLCGR